MERIRSVSEAQWALKGGSFEKSFALHPMDDINESHKRTS